VSAPQRVRVQHLQAAKDRGERLVMLTAYDAVTARIFDEAGVDLLLVGDSIGNTMHGYASTLPVTLDEMVVAGRAVAGAVRRAFVVVDLPFGTYEAGPAQALAAGVRVLKETGAAAVKLEGGRRVAAQIRALTDAGIPVVAHLGYTPQSENLLGGSRWSTRGPSPWCSRWCQPRWPRRSPRCCACRPSASAPAPAATARCWCGSTWPA
jgi:3-methyl-2-oxobutanoate hydroxymethyltransferase